MLITLSARNNFFVLFITVVASILLSGLSLYAGPLWGILAFALIALAILSLMKIQALFYLLFLWLSAAGFILNYFPLGEYAIATYVDEILVFLLLIFLSFKFASREVSGESSIFVIGISLFIIFLSISTLINKSPAIGLLNFVSTYLKFFIIFLCAVNLLGDDDLKRMITFAVFTVLIQSAAAALQYITFGKTNILVGSEITNIKDAACGLFGRYGAHLLGHFSVITLIISSSLWLFTGEKRWIFYSVISLVAFILSFTESDYIFIIFYILMLGSEFLSLRLKGKHERQFRFIGYSMLLFLILLSVYSALNLHLETAQRYKKYLTSASAIKGMGKMQALKAMTSIILEEPQHVIIGVGPGNFTGGVAQKVEGAYYKKYVGFRVRSIFSVADYWWSTFITLLSETGVLGYLVYASMFVIIYLKGLRLKGLVDPGAKPFDKACAFSLISVMIFLLFLSFMSNLLEATVLMFLPSILSAYVWKRYHILRRARL
ncbi:MAG: hypothetical protein A2987_04295 [Omnitrophica bacterium RIFCSPLOWO2_01_FULL_45_10]|nr:MAG: hypothetical protein A2987_04295 [Omnitrophica bacterium RIFCSPLOWO2_01_FULL_45_10]